MDLEELRNEWCTQVQNNSLSLGRVSLGDLDDRFDTVREEVSLDVEEFGRINDAGNLGFGEVIGGEFLGSSKGSAQVSVVTGNDDCTSSSSGRGRLDLVSGVDTFSLVGLFESLHKVIVTDGSDVGDRARWEDVLDREL